MSKDQILFIHNFRYGFATNSSSSHSVIILPKDAVPQSDTWCNELEFSWGNFVLSTPESKIAYLAANMISGYSSAPLKDNPDDTRVLTLLDKETGFNFLERFGDVTGYNVGVDHQSRMNLGDNIDEQIIRSLARYYMNPRVVIYGGNDNSDGMDLPEHTPSPVSKITDAHGIRARVDNGFFTLFNPNNGTKVRFSAEDVDFDEQKALAIKAKSPELVDVKITQFCPKNCQFCYMGSTSSGEHAPFERIIKTLDMLKEADVFEVAIGGGEPTTHPQFVEILQAARDRNIVPNFTTYTTDWLSHPRVKEISHLVGAIGVSCLSAKDIPQVEEIRKTKYNVMAQHVVGSVPPAVTIEFIRKAAEKYINILLLGFKEVGFGKDYTRYDDDPDAYLSELALVMETFSDRITMSVDTALINRFPTLPKMLGVPEATVTSPEGKFSCYVDAVEDMMGPSSYVDSSEMVKMPKTTEDFLKVFATY